MQINSVNKKETNKRKKKKKRKEKKRKETFSNGESSSRISCRTDFLLKSEKNFPIFVREKVILGNVCLSVSYTDELRLEFADCIYSLQSDKTRPSPKSGYDIVRIFGKWGVPLHCYYSLVHSDKSGCTC